MEISKGAKYFLLLLLFFFCFWQGLILFMGFVDWQTGRALASKLSEPPQYQILVRKFKTKKPNLQASLVNVAEEVLIEPPLEPIKYSPIKNIKINNVDFQVELAISQKEKENGLSNRDKLSENSGMLFLFDQKERYEFWMKDMKIPLDFVWISGDKIIQVNRNVQPGQGNTVWPKTPIDAVLELNGNTCAKYDIKAGDKIEFNF